MRISWLEPDVIAAARKALVEGTPTGVTVANASAAASAEGVDWDELFQPELRIPPAPGGVPPAEWPHIAEHVARAERVSQVVRLRGLGTALAWFGESSHAIELATLAAAAVQVDLLEIELLESLLTVDIDDLVLYTPFLELLVNLGGARGARTISIYEEFCQACEEKESVLPMWEDRVAAIRDGLASLYVVGGRVDDAHELFLLRHREDTGDIAVALSASRAFLAAGAVARAVLWLGMGADRARDLGRPSMEQRLREKCDRLRRRLS